MFLVEYDNNGIITMIINNPPVDYKPKQNFIISDEMPDINLHMVKDGKFVINPTLQQRREEEKAITIKRHKKSIKLKKVSDIKVTVNNKTFDGDEISQERMLRAINIANITGQTTTEWKLADNSIQTVTLDELKEALSLAGQEMSRIWLEN